MSVLIYIVDDEPLIVEMLGQYLAHASKAWNVACFTKPGAAIEAARQNQPNIVVSDFRMPEITGTDLLEQIRLIAPESIRILVSGFVQANALDYKLSSAHQYLAKPFSLPDIRAKLHKALLALESFHNEDIRRAVLSLRTLPALPKIYYELMATLEDPDSSYDKVESILAKDSAITAKVLQMANSPLFGGQSNGRTITNMLQCITMLGTERIKAAVLSHQLFKSYTGVPECFIPHTLPQHRSQTASNAYTIARKMGLSEDQARDAYVAGLLHDLGRLVLLDNFADVYGQVCTRAKAEDKPLTTIEEEMFNLSQSDVIGFLVALWGMRDRISSALTYQERPWDAPNADTLSTAAAVYLAHYKANKEHESEKFKQPELNREFIKSHQWHSLLD